MAVTQSEVAQMAHAAGFHRRHTEPNEWWGYTDAFERFAELVATRAAKEEREECAKLAAKTVCDTHIPTGIKIYGSRVADAIRARSDE